MKEKCELDDFDLEKKNQCRKINNFFYRNKTIGMIRMQFKNDIMLKLRVWYRNDSKYTVKKNTRGKFFN